VGRRLSRGLVLVAGLLAGGCMVSEQKGQLVPDGNPRYWDQKLGEVTFDFDSTWNRGAVFGRSAALVLVAMWVFALERGGKKVLSLVVGLPLLGLAAYLLYQDLPTLQHYRIAALESGLVIEIPPDVSVDTGWSSVESLAVTGWEMKRGAPGPLGKNPFTDVPEWEAMDVRLAGGDLVTVDLKRLSWEQRQSVWKAIAVRANLVERK
jgi:hypothetical protein